LWFYGILLRSKTIKPRLKNCPAREACGAATICYVINFIKMNLQKTGRKTTQLKPKPSEANQHNAETLPKTTLKRKQRKKES